MMHFSSSFNHSLWLISFGGTLHCGKEEERLPIAAEARSQPSLPHLKELILFFFWPLLFFYWRFSTVSSFVLSWQVGLFSKAVPPRIHTAFSSLSPARLPATANSFRSVKPRQLTTLATRVGMCHTAKQTAVGSSHLRVIAEVKWWSSKQTERGIPRMASLLCSNIRSECWRRDATW